MINGKTIQKTDVIYTQGEPTGVILSFTNGEQLKIASETVLDFHKTDASSGRNDWVHPGNLNA